MTSLYPAFFLKARKLLSRQILAGRPGNIELKLLSIYEQGDTKRNLE